MQSKSNKPSDQDAQLPLPEKMNSEVFDLMLDHMRSSIYITDLETDRILFMNRTMKEDFGVRDVEGEICWKVLQKGMTGRCPFCPIPALQQASGEAPLVLWEERNTRTGRVYQNNDTLLRWVDGREVHMQHSVDITELKSANTDELTQWMTRRAGKNALQRTMDAACAEGQTVTVCLYDVNLLKEVNDLHGHAEGDRLISDIANAVRNALTKDEYAFRLSGDEFVVVLFTTQKNAQKRIDDVLDRLHEKNRGFEAGFCYGMVEVTPEQNMTLDEVLFFADERMYEHKRRFHIQHNEQHGIRSTSLGGPLFQYDTSALYAALVDSTDDYLYICNMKTGRFRFCRAMVEEFDLPGEIASDANVWSRRVHAEDRTAFLESFQEIQDGRTAVHCVEYRVKNHKGEWVWVRCRGKLILDSAGDANLFAGFITNLGKRNTIDHLTGLYNKLEFEEQIERLLGYGETRGFSVLILGIDDLKHINDLYDRSFGDEVIRIAAQRLRTVLPAGASLYRLDGDEFGVLLDSESQSGVDRLYRTVQHMFEYQQEYEGKKYHISFSGGSVVCPADATTYQQIIKYVGYCLEHAKKHGKKRCVSFSHKILAERARTLQLVEALRDSVENGFVGFSLNFQPLVCASTGKLLGAEALARWRNKQFGIVSPGEFIPLLEQTGLIVAVGKWVLSTGLQLAADWCRLIPDFILDINLSYHQLRGDDFLPFLQMTLQETQYPPRNLVLEMTESYFARENESEHVNELFRAARAMQVRIAMDDFGTGYSALGMLKKSPADIIKIDQTFVRGIRKSSFDATFIRFIVELCHAMNITVCLEGVETQEEYELVSGMGLDMIQGYFFGRPVAAAQFYESCLCAKNDGSPGIA